MPPRYKRKKRSRRRKGHFTRNTSSQYSLMRSPVPTKFPTKFVYSDEFSLDPGVNSTDTWVFSANGLFKPNITVAGHQPRGFDQLMVLYDHYVVIGSKIILDITNPDNAVPVYTTIRIADSASTSATISDKLEDGWSRTRICSSNNGPAHAVLTHSVNPAKFLGRTNALSDSQLKGSVSTNPEEQCYYQIDCFGDDSLANPSPVNYRVRMEFMAVLIEPSTPAQS